MPVYIPNPDLKYWQKHQRKVNEEDREEDEIYAEQNVGRKDVFDSVRERYEESKTGAGYNSE